METELTHFQQAMQLYRRVRKKTKTNENKNTHGIGTVRVRQKQKQKKKHLRYRNCHRLIETQIGHSRDFA